MRVIFAGTPEFSVPTLRALVESSHEMALVVTQPDHPSGRGRRLAPCAVKVFAVERGVPVFQAADVNAPPSLGFLRSAAPDIMVVQAFGQKLSGALLALPRLGCYNVHASLLPAYRGAAPVNWAVVNGERTTGVSVIRMCEQIDTGEILAQEAVAIEPNWTAGELAGVLAEAGATLMVRVLGEVEAGTVEAVRQDPSKATQARRLTKRDGLIPWQKSARAVHDHIRGMTPWPGAFTTVTDGRTGKPLRVVVLRGAVAEETGSVGEPGTVVSTDGEGLIVSCGDGAVRIEEVRPAGGRAMSAGDFARGHAIVPQTRFAADE